MKRIFSLLCLCIFSLALASPHVSIKSRSACDCGPQDLVSGPTGPTGPTGVTGPTGPTEPAEEISLQSASLRLASNQFFEVNVPLVFNTDDGSNGTAITYTNPSDSFTINETGNYYVNVVINNARFQNPPPDAQGRVAIQINGSSVTTPLQVSFSGQVSVIDAILTISAGDVLQVANLITTDIELAAPYGASISIIKLSGT